jgi:hypothetical protein
MVKLVWLQRMSGLRHLFLLLACYGAVPCAPPTDRVSRNTIVLSHSLFDYHAARMSTPMRQCEPLLGQGPSIR